MKLKLQMKMNYFLTLLSVFFLFDILQYQIAKADNSKVDVLLIGDSHVYGFFGESLYKKLDESFPGSVHSYGAVGASAISYTSENEKIRHAKLGYSERWNLREKKEKSGTDILLPQLSELFKKHDPKVLVIELGDNFADYVNHTNGGVLQNVREIKKNIQQLKIKPQCFWVSPLWTSQDGSNIYHKTNERLQQVIAKIKKEIEPTCTFIDSTHDLGLNKDKVKTGSDGLHFDSESGKIWGNAAADFIIPKIKRSSSGSSTGTNSGSNSVSNSVK